VTEEPYPPLRPQRPAQPPRRTTPWPMILGVAVLALLAGAVLAILVGERDGDGVAASPAGSESVEASPSASQSGSPAPSESASPTASGSASTAATLPVGDFVEPTVDGVTLRETPSTSGTRIGSLPRDVLNLVVEGPVEADGYTWYRLSGPGLPPSSGCITPLPTTPLACPIWFGWAAVQDPADGTAWFAPADVDCPDPDTETAAFLQLAQRIPLGCYGADEVSFTAWYPELPSGAGPGEPCDVDPAVAWLYCAHLADDAVWTTPDEAQAFQPLFIDPESGVTMPARGQWLRIRAAFDHPDAPMCAAAEEQFDTEDPDPDLAVLECRTHLVVRAVEVTAAP
jgi:hypothetical protein